VSVLSPPASSPNKEKNDDDDDDDDDELYGISKDMRYKVHGVFD